MWIGSSSTRTVRAYVPVPRVRVTAFCSRRSSRDLDCLLQQLPHQLDISHQVISFTHRPHHDIYLRWACNSGYRWRERVAVSEIMDFGSDMTVTINVKRILQLWNCYTICETAILYIIVKRTVILCNQISPVDYSPTGVAAAATWAENWRLYRLRSV